MANRSSHPFLKKRAIIFLLPLVLCSCGKGDYGNVDFTYSSSTGDYASKFFYTDDYFRNPSNEYNPSLATASLSFAMASFASSLEENITKLTRYANIETLFENTGFTGFQANADYHKKSGTDTIGLVFANKKIDGKTLIYVGIRGAGYEAEWASNLSIADPVTKELRSDGYHYGFRKAADQFIEELRGYLESHYINGDIKLWTSGYSRAGATANIASGLIDESIDAGTHILGEDINLAKEDFYAYCFEPPMGAPMIEDASGRLLLRGDSYSNIFNHINFNDVVPLVAMKEVEFTRYGIDRYYPDTVSYISVDRQSRDMKNLLQDLPNYQAAFTDGYGIDQFRLRTLKGYKLAIDSNSTTWTQGLFLREFVSALTKWGLRAYDREAVLPAKNDYVEHLQPAFRLIFDAIYRSGNFRASIIDLGIAMINDIVSIFDLDTLINDLFVADQREYLVKDLTVIVNRGLKKYGITFPLDEVEPTLKWFIKMFADFAGAILEQGLFQMVFSFFSKAAIKAIGSGHYPELCLAQTRSLDPKYVNNPFQNENFEGKHFDLLIPNRFASIVIKRGNEVLAKVEDGQTQNAKIPLRNTINGIEAILPYGEGYSIELSPDEEAKVTMFDYHYYGDYVDVDLQRQADGSFALS